MKETLSIVVRCCALLALLAGCTAEPQPEDKYSYWRLPDGLREISGLALTDDQRLLAVDDEVAVIHEIDFEAGQVVKTFSLGSPALRHCRWRAITLVKSGSTSRYERDKLKAISVAFFESSCHSMPALL